MAQTPPRVMRLETAVRAAIKLRKAIAPLFPSHVMETPQVMIVPSGAVAEFDKMMESLAADAERERQNQSLA